MTFTRRNWVALLAASPAAAQTATQAPPERAPEAGSKKASDDVRAASSRLAQIELPMNIEPAFAFKA